MAWVYNDGGRSTAGFKGEAGDCVVRAIAIAAEMDYREVYDALAAGMGETTAKGRTARNGVARKVYDPYLAALGWTWTPTMRVGSGCTVHARADELPPGRLILRLSKHLTAMIHGVIHDTYDPSRDGTRCVYGYWTKF